MSQTVFHQGELAAQALAGVASPNAAIRDWMPDQHRAFFGLLPFLPIATEGAAGAPVATILTGAPGFIASPDPNTLHIAVRPDADDPVTASLVPGARVGLLGIDLGTRRRNRANGRLIAADADGLIPAARRADWYARRVGVAAAREINEIPAARPPTEESRLRAAGITVSVSQSFGNCPQYIQRRVWRDAARIAGSVQPLTGLDAAARAMIGAADTFFVASLSGSGVDISHRGGRPGFVGIDGDTLTIPDFHGNHYFNTLGNLLLDPRAALVFVDWTDGTLLHLQGEVEILWGQDGGFEGAERLWRIVVGGGWRRPGAINLRWSLQDYAPQLQRTGTWDGAPRSRHAIPAALAGSGRG